MAKLGTADSRSRITIAVSELVQIEGMHSSGFCNKEKPRFTSLKKSRYIPKLL
jgi:hypothetical protein